MLLQIKLLYLFLIQLQQSASILNVGKYNNQEIAQLRTTQTGSGFLNRNRPLWILDDQVEQQDIPTWAYKQSNKRNQYAKHYGTHLAEQLPQQKHRIMPKVIKLPNHYLHSKSLQNQQKATATRRQQPPRNYIKNLPAFDYMPGQDINEEIPIFIYAGPKGELLFNTMFSATRYPMHEPTPGEILYPPTTPIFRPKPIIERIQMPGQAKEMNLTLIPFYAHEAIVPSYDNNTAAFASTFNTSSELITTTTEQATVVYGAPLALATPKKKRKSYKKRKQKKAKQYAVYRAADEVHWLPSTVDTLAIPPASTTTATPFHLALPNPLEIQQQLGIDINIDAPTTTTMAPLQSFELDYDDASEKFQITYNDGSLETPPASATTPSNKQSSRYALSKQYFAFPVYTLGKLLYTATEKPKQILSEPKANTWFILNSRYKGHHKHNSSHSYSSKYNSNPTTLYTADTNQ